MAACNNTKTTEVDEAEDLVGDAIEESQDMKYELSRFEPSTEYADAAITGMTYKNGTFDFTLADGEVGDVNHFLNFTITFRFNLANFKRN